MIKKPRGYWTKERCWEEALKYTTRREFKTNSSSAYNRAVIDGYIDEICSHIPRKSKPHGYWTKERCIERALKYETRSEFRQNDYDIYNMVCKKGWLDEVCAHMERTGNKMHRCIYVYEFSDNRAYVGLTCNLKKRNAKRGCDKNDAVTNYIRDTDQQPHLKQLTDYVYVDDAINLEREYINKYRNDGWIILNITRGGEIGGIPNKWTKETCHEDALKYRTRTKFKEKSYSAYTFAKENNWLDEICSHMVFVNTHRTVESCKIEALKYKTKPEFSANDSATYSWANNHGILDEICSHMTRKYKPKGYWTKERCHEEALKYNSRYEFAKHCGAAVDAAKRYGWYEEICSHMIIFK